MKFFLLLLTIMVIRIKAKTELEIHPFRAESNFICGMCRATIGYINEKRIGEGFNLCKSDATQQEYSPVCKKVLSRAHHVVQWLKKGEEPVQICSRFFMCPKNGMLSLSQLKWERPAINLTLIEEVNKKTNGKWVSGINNRFLGMSLNQVRAQLGAIVDPQHTYSLPVRRYREEDYVNFATAFDTRTQWPNCVNVSGDIRDQSACGSCWAFGSTEAYNDRLCIKTNGQDTTLLSPADTNSCCGIVECGSMGCNGGQPTAAWNWFTRSGVVTGGDYIDNNKTDTCEPYTFPPCAHHVISKDYAPCPKQEYRTPTCRRSCTNTGYAKSYSQDKNKASSAYELSSEMDIMTDITKYGSVSAAFTVYEDFLHYKSGVYRHTSGQALGGHAIKILGFGVENSEKYWLVANSWNNEWGNNGTFRILRGTDECGIESDVSAGQA